MSLPPLAQQNLSFEDRSDTWVRSGGNSSADPNPAFALGSLAVRKTSTSAIPAGTPTGPSALTSSSAHQGAPLSRPRIAAVVMPEREPEEGPGGRAMVPFTSRRMEGE